VVFSASLGATNHIVIDSISAAFLGAAINQARQCKMKKRQTRGKTRNHRRDKKYIARFVPSVTVESLITFFFTILRSSVKSTRVR
jgi:hypothetical protein